MIRGILGLIAILLLSLPLPANAEEVRLVADLATIDADEYAFPFWLIPADGQIFLYIVEATPSGPSFLWRADAAPGSLRPVRAFAPEVRADSSLSLSAFGDRLTFMMGDLYNGTQLWISDGTPLGTHPLETCPGPCNAHPSPTVPLAERFLFTAETRDEGREIWTSDGTPAGTSLLLSLRPGPASGVSLSTRIFHLLGDQALFLELADGQDDDPEGPQQLWITDGTAQGSELLLDLGGGACAFVENSLPGLAFFVWAPQPGAIAELWVTDGTTAGTRPLRPLDLQTPTVQTPLTDGDLLFRFGRAQDPSRIAWSELWRSNGTPEGTGPVAFFRDLHAHPDETVHVTIELLRLAHGVVVSFDDGVYGRELWFSDGTAQGTHLVADLEPGPLSSNPAHFTPVPGGAVFSTRTQAAGALWFTDGTAQGTHKLVEAHPLQGIRELRPFQGGGVFLHQVGEQTEIWRTDGTPAGTVRLHTLDILRLSPASDPEALVRHADRLSFIAKGDGIGREPFLSDGSAAGTVPLDLNAGEGDSRISRLTTTGDLLLVARQNLGILASDGTVAGTGLLAPKARQDFALLGRQLFYNCRDCEHGTEPWVADLDTGETREVKDINPGFDEFDNPIPLGSHPFAFTPFQERMFFFASNPAVGVELWSSNGLPQGTRPLETAPGPASLLGLGRPTVVDDQLFLAGQEGLWVTRGPQDTLHPIHPIPEGVIITEPMVGFRGRLFSVEFKSSFPPAADILPSLWSHDGTPQGSREILRGTVPGALPRDLTAAGGTLFFIHLDVETGWELWGTDGSPEGTRLIKDILPGPEGSMPRTLRAVDDLLLFSADDGVHGFEPWVSDGTAAGTRLLADVEPGVLASFPEDFTPYGGEIYFAADQSSIGRELFALERHPRQPCQPGDRRLCLQGGRFAVEVEWHDQRNNARGVGHAVPFSDDTGTFWFFNQANIELLVKTLDARTVNERFWFFSGALTDVAYWTTVTDTETGRVRTYFNPHGNLCGRSDVRTFDDTEAVPTTAPTRDIQFLRAPARGGRPAVVSSEASCDPPPEALLLQDGRFAVEVDWQSTRGGGDSGGGTAGPATEESGYFWFFDPANLELAIKVLDGRTINGHFWVLYGALSDVAYQIRVTDTETCETRIYSNEEFDLCGGADTRAF